MRKVLVFGGTRFFGRDLVQELVDDGCDVTIATRGRTRDSFGEQVSRLIVERNDRQGLLAVFEHARFETVFDNLCYSPNAAMNVCDALNGKIEKYVMTSTLSVYDQGLGLKESDFDPCRYSIRYGEREDFDYGEGKRLAEAVLFQKAVFPVTAVRFPVVISADDYTGRLRSYFDRIDREVPFYVDNLESEISLITADEAGKFLSGIAVKDFHGPINACCNGTIKISDMIKICEDELLKRWMPGEMASREVGAFNGSERYTMDNSAAKKLGFRFKDVRKAVEEVIGGF